MEFEKKVTELLNEAKVSKNEERILECLSKISEIIVHHMPSLIDNYLEEVLSLFHTNTLQVKLFIISFIEETCNVDSEHFENTVQLLSLVLENKNPTLIRQLLLCLSAALTYLIRDLKQKNKAEDSTNIIGSIEFITRISHTIMLFLESGNEQLKVQTLKYMEKIFKTLSENSLKSVPHLNPETPNEIIKNLRELINNLLESINDRLLYFLLQRTQQSSLFNVTLINVLVNTVKTDSASRTDLIIDSLQQFYFNLQSERNTFSEFAIKNLTKILQLQVSNLLKMQKSTLYVQKLVTFLLQIGVTKSNILKNFPKPLNYYLDEIDFSAFGIDRKFSQPGNDRDSFDKVLMSQQNTMPPLISKAELVEKLNVNNFATFIIHFINKIDEEELKRIQLPLDVPEDHNGVMNLAHEKLFKYLSDNTIKNYIQLNSSDSDIYLRQKEANIEDIEALSSDATLSDGSSSQFDDDNANLLNETQNLGYTRSDHLMKNSQDILQTDGSQFSRDIQPTSNFSVLSMPKESVSRKSSLVNHIHQSFERLINIGNEIISQSMKNYLIIKYYSPYHDIISEELIEYIKESIEDRSELLMQYIYRIHFESLNSKDTRKLTILYNHIVSVTSSILTGGNKGHKFDDNVLIDFFLKLPSFNDTTLNLVFEISRNPQLSEHGCEILYRLILRNSKISEVAFNMLKRFCRNSDKEIRTFAALRMKNLCKNDETIFNAIKDDAITFLNYLTALEPNIVLGEYITITKSWDEESTMLCLHLFMMLFSIRPEIINALVPIYSGSSSETKKLIIQSLDEPVFQLTEAQQFEQLMSFIEQCPKGSDALVIRCITLLSKRNMIAGEFIGTIRKLYEEKIRDIRLITLIAHGITEEEFKAFLPQIITLPNIIITDMFQNISNTTKSCNEFDAIKLLDILFNMVENSPQSSAAKERNKNVIRAIECLISLKSIYMPNILIDFLNRILEDTNSPLPDILMRFILKCLELHPNTIVHIVKSLKLLCLKKSQDYDKFKNTNDLYDNKPLIIGLAILCYKIFPHSLMIFECMPAEILETLIFYKEDIVVTFNKLINDPMKMRRFKVSQKLKDQIMQYNKEKTQRRLICLDVTRRLLIVTNKF
ncbi:MAG: hypothetical protein MHMPM18_000785 [Marteilia pararefringens]